MAVGLKGIQRLGRRGRPNPPLNSDPACIVFRSLSASRFLGFAQRLGAGGAGELHSLGRVVIR